jgi:DNA polymerase elongation subunit (family B)
MIISKMKDGKTIYKSWREGNEKKFEMVEFTPYFYVEETEREPVTYNASKYVDRTFDYIRGDWVNLKGDSLKKVCVENSYDIKGAKGKFKKTYEADVPFHFRYCIDEIEDMPAYNMRKWYWDMEWQQGGEHHNCITTIVMYDNYDKTYYQWAWFPNGENGGVKFDFNNEKPNVIFYFDNEKDMIENFMTDMIVKDPDMLIAWFGNFADIPKLLDRACSLGLNPLIMSPIGAIKGVKKVRDGHSFAYAENGFGQIEQPIGGRITLNLDLAFERQWNDSQRGTLPSMSLDYISELVLNKKKLVSEKFPDTNEFYRRAWLEDTQTYLEYAIKDVELIVELDETNYCSEAILSLQRLLKAPFDACFYASHMGSIYFMRNAWWKAPTGKRVEKREEYEGAMIYDPLSENTNGLHLNVAAFDFAQLYPSMMIARNISFETKSNEPTEFGVNILTPRDFSETTRTKMLYYKTDELGLLPRAVIELKELRNEYKALMREARETNNGEYVKWYNNQMAVKRLMASFYGIVAFQGFGWADVDLAASITASAREAIRLAAFKAKELEV